MGVERVSHELMRSELAAAAPRNHNNAGKRIGTRPGAECKDRSRGSPREDSQFVQVSNTRRTGKDNHSINSTQLNIGTTTQRVKKRREDG